MFRSVLDAFSLLGRSILNAHNNKLENFICRSAESTILDGDFEFNSDAAVSSNDTKQQTNGLLHDSTYTLCSQDPFSAYTEAQDNDQQNETTAGIGLRSHSLSILQIDRKSNYVDKAPKKAVRFADMMVC